MSGRLSCALIGNPSVGKSLIFNHLTGLGVEVSNYPGTTVDLMRGNVCYEREMIELVDLPGIYSLEGESEEETLVRGILKRKEADILIAVLDTTHLERNLYLLLQIAEYKIPTVVVLNMVDEAAKFGIEIDYTLLTNLIGSPVIPTIASEGKNMEAILNAARGNPGIPFISVPYDHHVEAAVRSLSKVYSIERSAALQALVRPEEMDDLAESAQGLATEIEQRHNMTAHQIIATNRHNYARSLGEQVTKRRIPPPRFDLDTLLTRTFPGIPILIAVIISILLLVFTAGAFFEEIIVDLFNTFAIEPFLALNLPGIAAPIGGSILIALQAGLGIAFPYVFIFYLVISIIEDSGYLTRAAFLADRSMHRFGMHGQGIIPMVLGFGCSVPALMSVRLLATRRERIIAAVLVTMIPCSARTVVISGIVASFIGLAAAFSVYGIVFLLVLVTGIVLSRITPGQQFGMILEMSALRMPQPKMVVKKAWMRLSEFLFIAMPLLLVSSVFLGIFEYFGLVSAFQDLITPYSEAVLGLPGFAATALLFGILRKEMAFETLAVLAGTADLGSVMTSVQLYIFAVVCVLFIPCISTIAVLIKEIGRKWAILISLYTVLLGIVVGALLKIGMT
ncbi:MAG: ferrous iron transport protein B [Methanocalculus sp.]|uniref:ferrous iron transport protein B n=1 Tax=Methanocalculus sp. TaxID=2004547 RepID=UPI002725A5CA|nr:ferrous iron transport protein B [Methanocalculus sp.]MDO9539996.1 ferrous iron transport protein B [Methanocalculus sp.]